MAAGVLVLGLGNLLLRDEGVGVHAVRRLMDGWRFPSGVDLVDGGTAGFDLLDILAGRERLIVIDAVRGGRDPGSLVRLEGDALPVRFRQRTSPHQLGLPELLATLSLTEEIPSQMVLFGVEPLTIEPGTDLSPVVADGLDALCAEVVGELRRHGILVQEKEDGSAA